MQFWNVKWYCPFEKCWQVLRDASGAPILFYSDSYSEVCKGASYMASRLNMCVFPAGFHAYPVDC